ncbi:FtsX-like permease family protein [Microbacterium sp. BWT-B31]|uniref:FtsX-like permease family protein n=1 Tax=Microbacterium sp. BWT-B31 TaxID=3232072 RepID=UPI00352960A3
MTLTESWLAAIDGTNALASTIEFSRHGLLQHADPVDAARVMFEDADPVREFPSWPGKRNFEGKLWMASTSRHVPFESFWERIIVIAETPELVAPVSDAVLSVIAPTDPTKVSMQTSEALAQLRALIQGQLGSFSRGLVLVITGLTGTLVAILLYGLVMMRRKDFGRRRALGATRGLIVVLLVTQTGLLALAGIALGLGVSLLTLTVIRAPLPGMEFTAALTILALAASLVAALVPALIASLREPIRELRVP